MNFFTLSHLKDFLIFSGLLVTGYFIALKLSQMIEKVIRTRFSRHLALLFRRALFYLIFTLFILMSLQNAGVNLNIFLGAAGLFTLAISFASQTAISNLISGIFLLFEKPFKIGDTILVNGINGVVESIDLLSTKLVSSDNQLIRIPNEKLIKSDIYNLSFYPFRRIDLVFKFKMTVDTAEIKALLLASAQACSKVLESPKPSVLFNQFTEGFVEIKLMAWVKTLELSEGKNCLQELIRDNFIQKNIEIATQYAKANP